MIAAITCTITGMIALTRFIKIGMSRFRACTKMFAIWSISGATAAATMENICPRRGRTVAVICVSGGRRAAMTRVRAPKIEVTIGVAAATSCPNTCARTGTMTCAMFASRGATTFSAEPRESPRMPAMVPSWEPSAWRAPEIAGDWNASPRVLKAPEMASLSSWLCITIDVNNPMTMPTGPVRPENTPPMSGICVRRGPRAPARPPMTGSIPPRVCPSWEKPPELLSRVIASPTRSPKPTIPSVRVLIFPAITSTPIASRIEDMAFLMRLPAFVKAVAIPRVAVRACVSKDATPSIPSELSFNNASLKSSKETVPSFIASKSNLELLSAPRMDWAIWFI